MLAKNNQEFNNRKMNQTQFHYSLRKLNVGVVSVFLGVGIGMGLIQGNQVVHAATDGPEGTDSEQSVALNNPVTSQVTLKTPVSQEQPGPTPEPVVQTGSNQIKSESVRDSGEQAGNAVNREESQPTSQKQLQQNRQVSPMNLTARSAKVIEIPAPDPTTPEGIQQRDSYAPKYTVNLPAGYPYLFTDSAYKDYYVFKGIQDNANQGNLWAAVKADGSDTGTLYLFWQPLGQDIGQMIPVAKNGHFGYGGGDGAVNIYNYGDTYTVIAANDSLTYLYSSDGEQGDTPEDEQNMITGVLPTMGRFEITLNYTGQDGQITQKTVPVNTMAGMNVKVAGGAVVGGYVKTDQQTGLQNKTVSEYTKDKVGQTWVRHFGLTQDGNQYNVEYTLQDDGNFTLKIFNHEQLLTGESYTLDGKEYQAGADGVIPLPVEKAITVETPNGYYHFPNPYVTGTADLNYDYHQVGKIVPVGPDGKTPLANLTPEQTPAYPNDPQDPAKVVPNEKLPQIPGYTLKPGQPVVNGDGGTVTPSDPIKDTDVIYLKDQVAQVEFIDQTADDQELSRDGLISGLEGETVTDPDYQTSFQKYLDQGYELVRTDYKEGTVFPAASVTTTKDNPYLLKVILRHGTDVKSLQSNVTRTIQFVDENGKQVVDPVEGTAHFTASGVLDKVTGEWIVPLTWTGAQTINGIAVPAVAGYHVVKIDRDANGLTQVKDVTVTHGDASYVVTVTYTKDATTPTPTPTEKGSVNVLFHDDTTNTDLTDYNFSTGPLDDGTTDPYTQDDIRKKIDTLTAAGYVFTRQEGTLPATIDGETIVKVYVKHGSQPITPETPITEVPKKTPKEAQPDQLTKTVTETVTYVNADGTTFTGTLPANAKQTVTFTGTAYVDKVTGKLVNAKQDHGNWVVDKDNNATPEIAWVAKDGKTFFDAVTSPVEDGYHVSKVSGHADGNNVAAITGLTQNSANVDITVTYAKDATTPTPTPTPTPEDQVVKGTQTVHYVDQDGNELKPTATTGSVTFTKSGKTGQWDKDSYTYGKVVAPVIPGYVATVTTVNGATVTPEDPNQVITITYTKVGKIIPVDPGGNPIPGVPTPKYPNDPNDPTKVTPKEPVPEIPGWTPQTPTVTPGNPTTDTPVTYVPDEPVTPKTPGEPQTPATPAPNQPATPVSPREVTPAPVAKPAAKKLPQTGNHRPTGLESLGLAVLGLVGLLAGKQRRRD